MTGYECVKSQKECVKSQRWALYNLMVVEFYKLLMSFDFFFFNYVSFSLHIYVVSNSPLEVDKVWLEKEDGKVSTKNIVIKDRSTKKWSPLFLVLF